MKDLIKETIVSKKQSSEAYLDFTEIKKDIINVADYLTDLFYKMKDLNLMGNNILNVIDLKSK